jgi:hypothetical protein
MSFRGGWSDYRFWSCHDSYYCVYVKALVVLVFFCWCIEKGTGAVLFFVHIFNHYIFLTFEHGLAYFRVYVKQLMQINMSLCIIYTFVNVLYEQTVYEGTIFVSENL